jgi:hypothetical protein
MNDRSRVYYALTFEKTKRKKENDYLPILNILVPQTGQTPCVAGLPFFMVTFFSSFIVRLDLHFTQYASVAMVPGYGWG